jgi:hypothetical protein
MRNRFTGLVRAAGKMSRGEKVGRGGGGSPDEDGVTNSGPEVLKTDTHRGLYVVVPAETASLIPGQIYVHVSAFDSHGIKP